MRKPIEEIWRQLRGRSAVRRQIKQRVAGQGLFPYSFHRVRRRFHLAVKGILRKAGGPRFVEPLLERSALVRPALVIVARRDNWADAREVRWMGDSCQHL